MLYCMHMCMHRVHAYVHDIHVVVVVACTLYMGMDMDMDTSYSRTYYIGTYHDHGTGGLFKQTEILRGVLDDTRVDGNDDTSRAVWRSEE